MRTSVKRRDNVISQLHQFIAPNAEESIFVAIRRVEFVESSQLVNSAIWNSRDT